jgi:AraC family transcriptional regulator
MLFLAGETCDIILITLPKVKAMSEIQPKTVDFTQAEEVLQIMPRPALRSSDDLGWNGIYVQQHQQPAWETPEYAHSRHMILVHSTEVTVQAERWFDGRRQQEQFGSRTNIAIVPATVQHRVNWDRESPFSLIFVESDRLIQIAAESVRVESVELIPHHAMQDPTIAQIGQLLTTELQSNQFRSRLFADSLTIALSVHLLRHYADWQQPLREDIGGLPPRKLQRAIAYINDRLGEDLSIAAISQELEMSQYYFSRLFKQSIGKSPYQYVVQQRIERAKYLLRTTPLSVAAIALQVGFFHQNQLTIQFRKLTGTTPSNYRKQL